MEYELIDGGQGERCALVTRRDGGVEEERLMFRKEPTESASRHVGERRPAITPQMGE